MTCSACNANCSMSNNGLCSGCRKASRQPTHLRNLRRKASRRWVEGENGVLLRRYDLTPRQAIDRSIVALLAMDKLFARDTVYVWGLDNPYMSHQARRTMAAMVQDHLAARGIRKPVASARPVLQTRKVAA